MQSFGDNILSVCTNHKFSHNICLVTRINAAILKLIMYSLIAIKDVYCQVNEMATGYILQAISEKNNGTTKSMPYYNFFQCFNADICAYSWLIFLVHDNSI